ncbi:MAG: hypothetical protein H7Y38_11760, partial [Armatimonadetes bacterium]|nr:hypothetical protein [Armatimonadota bacterium]
MPSHNRANAVPVIALFWEGMVLHLGTKATGTPEGISWFMALWGLPFIAIGVAMLSAPFVAMARA